MLAKNAHFSTLCTKTEKGGNITNDGRSPVVAELKLREGPDVGREKGVYVRPSIFLRGFLNPRSTAPLFFFIFHEETREMKMTRERREFYKEVHNYR